MDLDTIKDKLIELIEPVIESTGLELIKLHYIPGRNGKLLLYIDSENGINVDHCEKVSKVISELLDEHDPIEHAYSLEVSSPGLDRPLVKAKHFIRFQGSAVKVKTIEPVEGSRNFHGIMIRADQEGIKLQKEDGSVLDLPYTSIDSANLWPAGMEKKKLYR